MDCHPPILTLRYLWLLYLLGMMKMTEEQFEEKYPKDKFEYVRTKRRVRGHLGQTEIDYYDIIERANGNVALQATREEHTNVRGLDTTVRWDW